MEATKNIAWLNKMYITANDCVFFPEMIHSYECYGIFFLH